jgi:hypothetical protein
MSAIVLAPESIEALADALAARLRGPVDVQEAPALLTAAELAERLHVSREWVYRHADELGAIRLPGGEEGQGRLRFDLALAANGRLASKRSEAENASTSSASARKSAPRRRRSPTRSPDPGAVLAVRPRASAGLAAGARGRTSP